MLLGEDHARYVDIKPGTPSLKKIREKENGFLVGILNTIFQQRLMFFPWLIPAEQQISPRFCSMDWVLVTSVEVVGMGGGWGALGEALPGMRSAGG